MQSLSRTAADPLHLLREVLCQAGAVTSGIGGTNSDGQVRVIGRQWQQTMLSPLLLSPLLLLLLLLLPVMLLA